MNADTEKFVMPAVSMNEQPAILAFPDSSDITKVVIEDLNRTAVKPHQPEPVKRPPSTKTGDKI